MQRARAFSFLSVGIFASLLLLPLRAAVAQPPPCPGPDNPGCIWKAVNPVPVQFNGALDPGLEQVRVDIPANKVWELGTAATRQECWDAAIAAWNAVLKDLCGPGKTPFQLASAATANDWGVDQGIFSCNDRGLPNPDDNLNPHLPATLKPVYDRKPAFLPDGKNVASTAKDNGNPGWINAPGVGTYDADRLAETYPKCNNTDNSKLDEADIGWMTHYTPDNMCTVIPWDYRYKPDAANPNDPGPVPYKAAGTLPKPDAFDFYSVMLHEIGHLLGLGHMTDPGGNNVMSAQIFPGTRLVISPTEKNCLKQLYCTDATPTKQESWGRIKLIYR